MLNAFPFQPRLHQPSASGEVRRDVPPLVGQVRLWVLRDTPHASRRYAAQLLCSRASLSSRIVDNVAVAVGEFVTASYLAGASIVDLAIELSGKQVTATVRDDRPPGWRAVPTAAADPLREALLDALTTTRTVSEDADGFANVARFSTA